jgi:hypothetical protein
MEINFGTIFEFRDNFEVVPEDIERLCVLASSYRPLLLCSASNSCLLDYVSY